MSGYFPTRLFEGQINFVKFLQFHPCADPMPILVETFFPCALRLAIDLYLYDAEDVAREVMRGYPKGGVGKPAARGLRHSFKKGDKDKPMGAAPGQSRRLLPSPSRSAVHEIPIQHHGPNRKGWVRDAVL